MQLCPHIVRRYTESDDLTVVANGGKAVTNQLNRHFGQARKPKIFFGCAMLGGYPNVSREVLAGFPVAIRNLGYELISDHQTRPGVIEEEASMDPAYIHDRDYAWLTEADAGGSLRAAIPAWAWAVRSPT